MKNLYKVLSLSETRVYEYEFNNLEKAVLFYEQEKNISEHLILTSMTFSSVEKSVNMKYKNHKIIEEWRPPFQSDKNN